MLTDAATVGDELYIYAFGVFNAANVTVAGGDFIIDDDLERYGHDYKNHKH